MAFIDSLNNLKGFMSQPVFFMEALKPGPEIQTLRLATKRFVFVFDADAAQEILIKKSDIYVQNRTIFDRIKPVTGDRGLVQLAGAESQEGRAKTRPMFSSPNLQAAAATIEQCTDELIAKLTGKSEFNVSEEMTVLILRTTLKILLGIDSPKLAEQIGSKFLRLNHLCGLRMRALAPAPLFLPTGRNLEITRLRLEIRELLAKEVERVLSQNANAARAIGVPEIYRESPDLIDQCMTFLFAGHETTAASISFALLLLAKYPEYQAQVALGNDEATVAAYKEGLRLFPPAYMMARQATRADVLMGHEVSEGDQVMISITGLHKNPKYFDRPNAYTPERFFEKLKHPFSFIPFGAGAKSCVGERLAYFESAIILKRFCQSFILSSQDSEIRSEPLITLHPVADQMIQISPRTRSHHAGH